MMFEIDFALSETWNMGVSKRNWVVYVECVVFGINHAISI